MNNPTTVHIVGDWQQKFEPVPWIREEHSGHTDATWRIASQSATQTLGPIVATETFATGEASLSLALNAIFAKVPIGHFDLRQAGELPDQRRADPRQLVPRHAHRGLIPSPRPVPSHAQNDLRPPHGAGHERGRPGLHDRAARRQPGPRIDVRPTPEPHRNGRPERGTTT